MSEKIPENYVFNESLYHEYKGRLTSLVNRILEDDDLLDEYMDDIKKMDSHLQEKYEDYKRYASWHIIAGSTIRNFDELIADDFPRDDSVISFIEMLERKYDEKMDLQK
jgi:hypothetical protein